MDVSRYITGDVRLSWTVRFGSCSPRSCSRSRKMAAALLRTGRLIRIRVSSRGFWVILVLQVLIFRTEQRVLQRSEPQVRYCQVFLDLLACEVLLNGLTP